MAPTADRVVLGRVAAALAAVFAILAVGVAWSGSLPGDRRMLAGIHDAIGTSIDDPALFIARLTDGGPLSIAAVVLGALLLAARRPADALWCLIAIAGVMVVNPLLKDAFGRGRPDVRTIPEPVSVYSFPSGHAANTAALVGAIAMVLWSSRDRSLVVILGGAFLAVVAFAQLAIGAHYPSDILAGWSWSAAWVALVSLARTFTTR
ncbi:MAG: phosphatase PAP2 family protein [Ilumatobacteraceae bacterium]